MKIELDGKLLKALRQAMHFSVNEITSVIEPDVGIRTWQKYEAGELDIPEKVAEAIYDLSKRFFEICEKPTSYHYNITEFQQNPDIEIPDDAYLLAEFRLHNAAFCSGIVHAFYLTNSEQEEIMRHGEVVFSTEDDEEPKLH